MGEGVQVSSTVVTREPGACRAYSPRVAGRGEKCRVRGEYKRLLMGAPAVHVRPIVRGRVMDDEEKEMIVPDDVTMREKRGARPRHQCRL